MSEQDSTSKNDEQSSLELRLQLQLTASVVSIVAQALGILSILKALEESKADSTQEEQGRQDIEEQFQRLQLQIDQLTAEIAEIKLKI